MTTLVHSKFNIKITDIKAFFCQGIKLFKTTPDDTLIEGLYVILKTDNRNTNFQKVLISICIILSCPCVSKKVFVGMQLENWASYGESNHRFEISEFRLTVPIHFHANFRETKSKVFSFLNLPPLCPALKGRTSRDGQECRLPWSPQELENGNPLPI